MSEIDERIQSISNAIEENKDKYNSAAAAMKKAGEELRSNTDADPSVISQLSSEYARTAGIVAELDKRMKALEEQLENAKRTKEEGETTENSIINVEQLCSNIRAVIKDKGAKIGQLEADAKVQTGYLSRIEKNPGKSTPSLEFVYTVAKELDTSIDFLVDGHYGSLTDTEKYILRFMKRIEEETTQDKIVWSVDLSDYIESCLQFDNNNLYPFIIWNNNYGCQNAYYEFHIPLDGYFSPAGRSYHCQLPGTPNEIYLLSLQRKFGDENHPQLDLGYVLYITKRLDNRNNTAKWDEQMIASTFTVNSEIRKELDSFYEIIEEATSHIQISGDTKNAIEAFMNGRTITTSDDDSSTADINEPNADFLIKDEDLPF